MMLYWHLFTILLVLGEKLSESTILRMDPDLEQYFINTRNTYASVSQSADPFFSYNTSQRIAACRELLEARKYHIIKIASEFPALNEAPASILNIQTMHMLGPSITGYNPLTVSLNQAQKTINALLCRHTTDDQYWYLTYGYSLAHSIVLEKRNQDALPYVLGYLEPTPVFEAHLYGFDFQESLELLFLERNLQNPLFGQSHICLLTTLPQFMVCTAVFDAWNQTVGQAQVRDYYIKLNSYQCKERQEVQLARIYHESPSDYGSDIAIADILPCTINREFHSPSFYITADPVDKSSVFVIVDDSSIPGKYKVVAHITGITSLM